MAFAELTAPLLAASPVQHTVELSVLHTLVHTSSAHRTAPVLLTVHDGGELVGAAVRTPPYPLISSAVPVTAADAVVQALAESDPELPGFTGPVAVVGALVAASGRVVVEETRLRLFILGELIPPTGVRGSPRLLAEDDLGLVGS